MDNESKPETDIITQLGYLCLGSRLKRLGERMQGSVSHVLADKNAGAQPAQLPLLIALAEDGALAIGTLSQRVGISQPGITRALVALEAEGLVRSSAEGRDRRQRVIDLTVKGQALIGELERAVFPAVEKAVEMLCRQASADFLGEIARIEEGLRKAPLDVRIAEEMAHGG